MTSSSSWAMDAMRKLSGAFTGAPDAAPDGVEKKKDVQHEKRKSMMLQSQMKYVIKIPTQSIILFSIS